MSGIKRKLLLATSAIAAAVLALALLAVSLAWGMAQQNLMWLLIGAALLAALTALGFMWRFSNDTPEFRELGSTFDSLRASLHAGTISRDYLDRVLSSMNEAMLLTDPSGVIERSNVAAREMLGYEIDALTGKQIDTIIIEDDQRQSDDQQSSRPREGLFRRCDNSTICIAYTVSEIRNDDGELEYFVYSARDIDDRKRIEQRIRYLATTDTLTKIANRTQFQDLLQQEIARANRSDHYLGLLYLDVDKFKDINDTFGHAAGDTSLEIFARRIVDVLPDGAMAGRLAGDEFAVLTGGLRPMEKLAHELTTTSKRLLKAVGEPFLVQGEEIFMTTSIGVALYPHDGDNVVDLLRNAEAALYQAKQAGGNCFEFYSTDMNTAAEERLKLKSKLRRAFERDELRLHYQPKYCLQTGRIEGAEALIRWDLPDRGLVFPSDFIPLAEETNLILQIGDWVLNRVCADYRRWQRLIPSPCRISMNLSLRQLQQQRFLEGVRSAFRSHGVSPTCLELEITETTLMEDTNRTIRILDALYGMGLHLAIDDFGTGYSSLSALQQFPISTLKIDRSFVRDLAIDTDNAAIVSTIIKMAHSLKLDVVAEGVESQEQLDFLRAEGCDYAQGHLFGDPVAGEDFCALLVAEAQGSGRYKALFA